MKIEKKHYIIGGILIIILLVIIFRKQIFSGAKVSSTSSATDTSTKTEKIGSCQSGCENKYRTIINQWNAKYFKTPLTPSSNCWSGYPSSAPPANPCASYEALPINVSVNSNWCQATTNLPQWCQDYKRGMQLISRAYDCCISKCNKPGFVCSENIDPLQPILYKVHENNKTKTI